MRCGKTVHPEGWSCFLAACNGKKQAARRIKLHSMSWKILVNGSNSLFCMVDTAINVSMIYSQDFKFFRPLFDDISFVE